MRGRMAVTWIDLLDPTKEELRAKSPRDLEETAFEVLLDRPEHDDEPRPTLQGHGDYIFGNFLAARAETDKDTIYYQEVGLVITCESILTVRTTPGSGFPPFDMDGVRRVVRQSDSTGMIAYRIVDSIAEAYLDLVDDV